MHRGIIVMALSRNNLVWLVIYFSVLIWSAIHPKDYPTWAMEVAPAVIALLVMSLTRNKFPLTPLLYGLILFHCVVLMIGGHYTYAEVPAFDWLKEAFDLQRNNYDKLGHLTQGFVPAVVAREILLRLSPLRPGKLLIFIVCSIALAISALYEMIEWWVALISEEAAESFLGTQGYIWDTQSDMFWALFGAITAQLLLNKWHDHQLQTLSRQHDISGL
jgi:putative membrane protein